MLKELFYIFIAVTIIASLWKIFLNASQPGWAAIVPVYNLYILTRITEKPWWWVVMLFIPLVNLIFGVWLLNLLSHRFGRNDLFTLGLIFLPFFFFPILAWQKRSV